MWTKLKPFDRNQPNTSQQLQKNKTSNHNAATNFNYQLINKIYISHTKTFDSEHFATSERDINVFIPR